MLLSDLLGAVAGILLAVPPLKDQAGRFREWQHSRKGTTVVPAIRGIIMRSLRAKRESFNGYDTLFLGLGSLGILLSFALRILDL